MRRFTHPEEKFYNQIAVLQECVSEIELFDSPCPLLKFRLEEMKVLISRLYTSCDALIREMGGT